MKNDSSLHFQLSTLNSQLPKGYKQTEVGMIPKEWGVSRLGDCGEVIMGQSPPGSSYNRTGIGSPLINGPTEVTDRYPIKIQWTTQPARFCKTGDLLICVRGSSTGRTNYANGTYAIGRGVAAIRAKDNNDTEYLSYQVISGVSEILAAATGSTFPSVDGASFRKIVVPLPSPAEQRAIAEALSDVDTLIGTLDSALSKKRDLKQAAMQQLLTGQKRLPGFHGEWEAKGLGEIGEFKNGINKSSEAFGQGSPFVNLMDVFGVSAISNSKLLGLINSTDFEQKTFDLRRGDVVFIRSSVKPSGVGLTAVIENDLPRTVYSGFLIRFRDGGLLDLAFKKHCFHEEGFRKRVISSSSVSANTNINQDNLKRQIIPLPPTKAEQTAIAEVLSDMDAELAALTLRRDKTRALKQGMMQELLTGRIRLV